MSPEGADEADEISDRVARGFEALVDEEALFPATPPLTRPSAPGEAPDGTPGPPSATGPAQPGSAVGTARLDRLEERVRQTMDRLTELVEAQLPEAVDGLRADLETLRFELQTALSEATEQQAEERRELRMQIATTVGAANRWFVRTRDQLYERLDNIAEVAGDAHAQAEAAATAASAAATAALPAPPALPARALERQPVSDVSLEWDVEEEKTPAVRPQPAAQPQAIVSLAMDAPELAALLTPVRTDVQELQTEISTMGETVAQLRDTVERLERRMARSRTVRLDPSQIELIVEAMVLATPTPAPAPSPAVRAAPAAKKARTRAAKKAATPVKSRTSTAKATAKVSAKATAKKAAARSALPRRTPWRSLI